MLFRELLLPFEVTSVLILVAILGAVALARRQEIASSEHMIPIAYYLVLSAVLFSIGVVRFPHQAQPHHHLHVD